MFTKQDGGAPSDEDPDSWQAPAEDLAPRTWDVAVVGAGPAGSTLARCLASAGHDVLLLDRHRFPRDKVCGDALIPDALNALRRAGLYDDVAARGYRADVLCAFSPSRIEVALRGEYVTLKRSVLDALLARAAVKAGAMLSTGTVETIEPISDKCVNIHVRGVGTPQRARVAVIATGADVGLLNRLGMATTTLPTALAVRRYVHSRTKLDRLIVSYDRRVLPAYGWIFPLGGGEYNVGCGLFLPRRQDRNLQTLLSRFLEEFPLAKQLMAEATSLGELRGAPLRCGLKGTAAAAKGNVLAIGETIGATFPFTGEGIGKAMETAEIAAESVMKTLQSGTHEPLASLPSLLQKELSARYIAYETAQRWISRPWMNDLIAWRTRRSKYMRNAFEEMIADRRDVPQVFSLRGLLQSALT